MDFFLKKTDSFSLHKMIIDCLEWCELLVNYCDDFISCLDSNYDGTHSLQMIHYWASDGIVKIHSNLVTILELMAFDLNNTNTCEDFR